jgi:hypothetical protein
MKRVNKLSTTRGMTLALFGCIGLTGLPAASAAPTTEVAKRCLHYAYIVYPFKRPGAVPMSGDREAYFRDCLAKNGEVPAPARPNKAGSTNEKTEAPTAKDN